MLGYAYSNVTGDIEFHQVPASGLRYYDDEETIKKYKKVRKIMIPLFGTKYDDGEIAMMVEQALTDAPTINPTDVQPNVNEGVIRLEGSVANEATRQRAVKTIRQTLEASGVAYDRIEDHLAVA